MKYLSKLELKIEAFVSKHKLSKNDVIVVEESVKISETSPERKSSAVEEKKKGSDVGVSDRSIMPEDIDKFNEVITLL